MVYWPSETPKDTWKKKKKKAHCSQRSEKYERVWQNTIETQTVVLFSDHHGNKHYDSHNIRWIYYGSTVNFQCI